jgi:hypothetical protein
MRQPDVYSASAIKNWGNDTKLSNGVWVPARPCGHNAFSFLWRFKLAWSVLTGRVDCLTWEK